MLRAQICPSWTLRMHLQRLSSRSCLEKIPFAPARKHSRTSWGWEESSKMTPLIWGRSARISRNTWVPWPGLLSKLWLTTTTSMGTRVMAANSSSEFEAAATTCRPRSLRSASAKSWVWMRVLSATTMLTKSDPSSSRDGIDPPDLLVIGHRSPEPEGGETENGPFVKTLVSGERERIWQSRPKSLVAVENVPPNLRRGKPGAC